jgi:hypothetical protein
MVNQPFPSFSTSFRHFSTIFNVERFKISRHVGLAHSQQQTSPPAPLRHGWFR